MIQGGIPVAWLLNLVYMLFVSLDKETKKIKSNENDKLIFTVVLNNGTKPKLSKRLIFYFKTAIY